MGLLEDFAGQFLDWKTRTRKTIERNARDPAGLLASFAQDVQQGSAADKSAWDASRSVMPGVREAGIREMNARGQELGGLLGTFAGVGAKTANVVKLEQAKKMAKAGADPVDVWKQTGWTDQFPDGKWRFEISDDKAKPIKIGWGSSESLKQGDNGIEAVSSVFRHPDLGKAYPGTSAGYDAKGNRLVARIFPNKENAAYEEGGLLTVGADLGKDGNWRIKPSQTLHELQHDVQQREGFAFGGSPDELAATLPTTQEMANKLWKEKVAAGMDPSKAAAEALAEARYSTYLNLAGEAEARLTQSRMNLTPAERAARPPWLEFDVPREQQIVRGLLGEPTGPAMSVREPTKFQLAHAEAQRNAALPVAQGGLGLGPQNTAMERAKAMGFDTDAYHGKGGEEVLTEFDPERVIRSGYGVGLHSAQDPRLADVYANQWPSQQAVYPLKLKFDKKGNLQDWKDSQEAISDFANTKIMQSKGFDGLEYPHGGYWTTVNGKLVGVNPPDDVAYASFKPENIRSRFAAFDPKKKDSRDLLASMGLLGLLGAGAYGQEQ